MKNKMAKWLALSSVLVTTWAFAQTSVETNGYVREGSLRDEVWGLTPQVGMISYTDALGNTNSRATAGIGLEWNAAPLLSNTSPDLYVGISTGAIYAHPGSSNSNFFGANNNSGANMFLIPANMKVGYNLSDSARLSAHGGGNVIYRSVASAMILGNDSFSGDSAWKVYPNAGLDFEYQIGKNISLVARPDLTFTPSNDLFVATIGATILGY